MVSLFCSLYERDPDMFRFLLLVQHGQLERVTAEMQTPVTVLKAVIEAAVATGEIPAKDVEVANAMVLGMVLPVAGLQVYGRLTQQLDQVAARINDGSWRAHELGRAQV